MSDVQTRIDINVNINPIMLSTLFDRETKKSISDCVRKKRILIFLQLID